MSRLWTSFGICFRGLVTGGAQCPTSDSLATLIIIRTNRNMVASIKEVAISWRRICQSLMRHFSKSPSRRLWQWVSCDASSITATGTNYPVQIHSSGIYWKVVMKPLRTQEYQKSPLQGAIWVYLLVAHRLTTGSIRSAISVKPLSSTPQGTINRFRLLVYHTTLTFMALAFPSIQRAPRDSTHYTQRYKASAQGIQIQPLLPHATCISNLMTSSRCQCSGMYTVL
jgi:hypothetical protein